MKQELPLDFLLRFCGEVRPGHGEDNWCHSFGPNGGMLGVFDGCGGSGARKHSAYGDHTEAYMASRLCSGVFYEAFMEQAQAGEQALWQQLLQALPQRLRDNLPPQQEGGVRIKGSMVRTLPTTAAVAAVQPCRGRALAVTPVWAGDSRVYVLDASGLSQLSVDDSNQPDPMEGHYDDGVLTNVICEGKPVRLNNSCFQIPMPCVVLAATDGCYGYVTSPMEFEGMLLQTLMQAETPAQWEALLQQTIAAVAGDDHTLCLASFGFGTFAALKAALTPRYSKLEQSCLQTLRGLDLEDRDTRRRLWQRYRVNYMKYIEGGSHNANAGSVSNNHRPDK